MKVYRLTESDLHNMIKNTVNRILKEGVLDNNNMAMETSVINNIENIELDSIENNQAIFNAYGKDGCDYQIYADFYVNEGKGVIPSNDYDVPDDFDSDVIEISDVVITKWDEYNEENRVPYDKDFSFENRLASEIEEYLHSRNMINNH